jgi:hypothetical protein
MKHFNLDTSPEAQVWMAAALGLDRLPPTCTSIVFSDKDGVMGGFVFDRYTGPGGSIHVHWAGRDSRWLSRDMLRIAGLYIFDQLGCRKVFGEMPASLDVSHRTLELNGWRKVAVLEGYFPDDDVIVVEATADSAWWAPKTVEVEPHGQT